MFSKQSLSKDRKVRFAILGCGRIAGKHLEAIRQYENEAELVAIADTNSQALERFSKETGVAGFDSLQALLSDSKADAVILSTPSGLHAEQGKQVARAKKHVITEKPMATTWEDGKSLVETCDANGVQLFVVKQNRLNPTLKMVKDAVEGGRFGRIFMVTLNVFWSRPQEYYDSASWRGTWEFDGGALMNQASHYVDLLDWIVGPVESVQAYAATLSRRIEVEDTSVVAVKWRSGALGSINVTMLNREKNFEGSMTIIGEKGTVRVGGMAVNEIQHWDFAEETEDDKKIKDASYETTSVYGHGHGPYYKNVIAALRGQEKPLTDGREGLRSLELLIASYRSARDGSKISLPLDY